MECCREARVDSERADAVETVRSSPGDLDQAASWSQVAKASQEWPPAGGAIDEYVDDDGELSPGREFCGPELGSMCSLVGGSKVNKWEGHLTAQAGENADGENVVQRRSSLGSYDSEEQRGSFNSQEADLQDPGNSNPARRVHREKTMSAGSASGCGSHVGPSSNGSASASDDESPTKQVKKVMSRWSHGVVLRATDLNVVLRRFGTIFVTSEGTDADYRLSKPVPALQWFISHNWCTPRLQKWMTLVLHFNFLPACVCTVALLISTLALTAHGALPLVTRTDGSRIGIVAQMTGTLGFLFVLFTWQELGGRVGLQRRKVFLDKVCIIQSDAERKAKDIMKLAAFLKGAEGLLVVYSDAYLRRLWTVYELASVLILYPGCKVKVIPTWFPMYFLCGTLLSYLLYVLYMISRLQSVEDFVGYPLDIVPVMMGLISSTFGLILGRRWLTMQGEISNAGENFNIALAAVTEEADRHLVMNSVEYFMKCKHLVTPQASQEEALHAFNSLVRDQLPRFVMNSFGRRGIPYAYVMMIYLPQTCRLIDLLGAYVHQDLGGRVIMIKIVEYLTMHLAFLPLTVATCSLALKLCPKAYKMVRGAVVGGFILATSVISLACWWGLKLSASMAHDSDPGLVVFLGICALVVCISWYIFRPAGEPTSHCSSSSCCGVGSKDRRRRRQPGEDSGSSSLDSQPSMNSVSIAQNGGGQFEEFEVD